MDQDPVSPSALIRDTASTNPEAFATEGEEGRYWEGVADGIRQTGGATYSGTLSGF